MQIKNLKFKQAIHPYLLKVLTSKVTGELEVKGEFPTDETCLIVANHLCIEDIPTLAQAVQEHFYLLVSDEDKNTLDGVGLALNGVRWVHRTDKKSRQEAAKEIPEYLKQGINFAMYPEATWNLSPNQLILPLNYGCIRTALQANTPIVPVVTFFNGEGRHTIIGEKFYPTPDLKESISELRDRMATMVYEEIEHDLEINRDKDNVHSMMIDGKEYLYEKRDEIEPEYWKQHIDELYEQYGRAKKDKNGVREFESQFIFTPKTDEYAFFQDFNSTIRYDKNGKPFIKRISSERNGYTGTNIDAVDFQEFFGFGYNETFLTKENPKTLKKEAKKGNN